MRENFYALLICILRPVSVEQSFLMMNGIFTKPKVKRTIKIDMKEMIDYRNKGLTCEEIGKIYGISTKAARLRIKRYSKEVKY